MLWGARGEEPGLQTFFRFFFCFLSAFCSFLNASSAACLSTTFMLDNIAVSRLNTARHEQNSAARAFYFQCYFGFERE